MRFLIPAPNSKPKIVKRNRVTTSWSLGESRSKSDMSNRHKRQNIEANGNISLRHHLPCLWPCQDLCRREKHCHRWGAAGPDTIVWYRRDTVWTGRLEHPFAKWNSSIGSRCLQVSCLIMSGEQRRIMGLTFAKIGDLPFRYDALDWCLVMKF